MGLFSPKVVDAHVLDWQFEKFEYLIQNLSSGPGLPDSNLWQPVAEHFGHPSGATLAGKALARFTFKRIKEQCGFGPANVFKLRIIDTPKGGAVGGLALVKMEGASACGTYQVTENSDGSYTEVITIDEALTERPVNLIATLAHEVSHALHNRMRERLDIEPELYELFTDLTAIYLGYGIFLANSRFEFGQFQSAGTQGWQASGAGYLPEADMIMATAIFMKIKNLDQKIATPHLKPRLAKLLKKAFKQLEKYSAEIEALRNQKPIQE